MKVDYHDVSISVFMSPCFFESMEVFAKNFAKKHPKAKKLQFHSSFFLPDGRYPFVDESFIYYPLTVIYSPKKHDIVWICWTNDENVFSKGFPFAPLKIISISVCEAVPEDFKKQIEGKLLCFYQNRAFAKPVIDIVGSLESLGKYNQSFADVMSEQVSKLLIEAGCEEINSRWSLEILNNTKTYTIDGKNYRRIELKTALAECIYVGVCWDAKYDVSDYVSHENIIFHLTEKQFEAGTFSFEQIRQFCKSKKVRH